MEKDYKWMTIKHIQLIPSAPPEASYPVEEIETMSNFSNMRHNADYATAEQFRDFLLVAAANGARVGYDESGDMWAVVNEDQLAEAMDRPSEILRMRREDESQEGYADYCAEFAREHPPLPIGQITFSDGPATIYAFNGEKGPNGEFMEWKPCPSFDGDEGRLYFYLTLAAPTLVYDPSHGWAVDAEGDTCEYIWYPAPTIPANRIEEIAREQSLVSV